MERTGGILHAEKTITGLPLLSSPGKQHAVICQIHNTRSKLCDMLYTTYFMKRGNDCMQTLEMISTHERQFCAFVNK